MKRLFVFTIRLAIFVALAVWLADQPGTARIIWHGYVIETSAAVLALFVLGIGFVFYLLFRFWHLVRHGHVHWRLRGRLKKWEQGHEHLTEGLVAIAGGDASEAGRRAVQARRLLGTTAATRLLQAQAAQLAGDYRTAQEIFRSLAAETSSAVLGYRGLIMEARRARDWPEMEKLIEKLHRLRPETPWLNLIRFELLARRQSWDEAGKALTQAASSRLISPARVKQNRAALFAALSQQEARLGRHDKALQAAEQAMRQAPEWLPAIITLARAQAMSGHRRAMQRTVERHWARTPHPQLANLWRAGDTDPVDACRQIEKLCRQNEDAAVSHFVVADAALAADIWGTARRHLMTLIGRGEVTQSIYRLMARLERRESGDEQGAAQWMMKAADAPADPTWLCQTCGGTHTEWQASCGHCGGFNTLEWQSPGVSRGQGAETGPRDPEIVGELVAP